MGHKFDLDLVFTLETFEGGTNCHLWIWKNFMSADTTIEGANILRDHRGNVGLLIS